MRSWMHCSRDQKRGVPNCTPNAVVFELNEAKWWAFLEFQSCLSASCWTQNRHALLWSECPIFHHESTSAEKTLSLANGPTANLFERRYLSDFQMYVSNLEFISITTNLELWTNSFATQITIGRGVEGETPAFWTRPQSFRSTYVHFGSWGLPGWTLAHSSQIKCETGNIVLGWTGMNLHDFTQTQPGLCSAFVSTIHHPIIPSSQLGNSEAPTLTLSCPTCGTGNIQ